MLVLGGHPKRQPLGNSQLSCREQAPHNAAREGRVDRGSKALDARGTRGLTGRGERAQETLEGWTEVEPHGGSGDRQPRQKERASAKVARNKTGKRRRGRSRAA